MMPDKFTIDLYNKMLNDFGVKSEEELITKLEEDALTLPCIECHKEFPIDCLSFPQGDPVCKKCLEELY